MRYGMFSVAIHESVSFPRSIFQTAMQNPLHVVSMIQTKQNVSRPGLGL